MHPFLQQLFLLRQRLARRRLDYPFARSDVAMLQRLTGERAMLDGQTWDELLLDHYAAQLARETSIFGQQELHRRLSGGRPIPPPSRASRPCWRPGPGGQPASTPACPCVRPIWKWRRPLFGAAPPAAPWWSAWLWLLPLALLLAIAASWLVGWPALFGVLAACVALMAVQVRFYESCQAVGAHASLPCATC